MKSIDIKKIDNIVSKAKRKCLNIKDGEMHRLFRDRWVNRKRVLRVICNKLYGINDSLNQEVSVSSDEFLVNNRVSYRQEDIIYETLDKLIKEDVILPGRPKIDAIHLVRKGIFYNGRAIFKIKDGEYIEKLYQEIASLCVFIEDDGRKRFPDKYKQKDMANVSSKEIAIIGTELDENNKLLIIYNPKEQMKIGFKEKKIRRRDKKFDIFNTKAQDARENAESETKLFKAFATYYTRKKEVGKFSQKEKLDNTTPDRELSEIIGCSINAVKGYQKRMRKLFKDNNLPMQLITDNKGNYQLIIKINGLKNESKK